MAIPMEIAFKGVNNIWNAVKGTNQLKNNVDAINKATKTSGTEFDTAMKKAEKFTFMDNILGGISNKISAFAEKQEVFKKVGGRVGIFGNQLKGIGNSIGKLTGKTNGLGKAFNVFGQGMQGAAMQGKGFFGSIMSGFGAVRAAMATGQIGLTSLIAGFGTLGAAILTALWPIALIAAAIFTLKKIWDTNMGGIQTKFNAIMGMVKTAWAKFNIFFIKTLRKLQPLFNFVFGTLFKTLKGVFAVIGAIFDALKSMFEPIIDAFAEVFAGLGKNNKGFSLFGDILLSLIHI